jgi:hypothetical protein
MPSFTITPAALSATFTAEQSSAIAALSIEGSRVEVSYQSRPEQSYAFDGSPSIVAQLRAVMAQPEQLETFSLGGAIAKARRSGHLTEVELAAAS